MFSIFRTVYSLVSHPVTCPPLQARLGRDQLEKALNQALMAAETMDLAPRDLDHDPPRPFLPPLQLRTVGRPIEGAASAREVSSGLSPIEIPSAPATSRTASSLFSTNWSASTRRLKGLPPISKIQHAARPDQNADFFRVVRFSNRPLSPRARIEISHNLLTAPYNKPTPKAIRAEPVQFHEHGISWSCRAHADQVTRVFFLPDKLTVVSCSLDGSMKFFDLDRLAERECYQGHTKGITALAWSNVLRVMATASLDHTIMLWIPGQIRPQDVLIGHTAPVLEVAFNNARRHVLSLSSDKVIRIWDVATHSCFQTILATEDPEISCAAMAFDSRRGRLISASRTLAVYKVVTIERDGVVLVWDAPTGKFLVRFGGIHGRARPTAATFDTTERRLITGSSDGQVKIWNFSSGQCLRTIQLPNPFEISTLLCMEQHSTRWLIQGGWGGRIRISQDAVTVAAVPAAGAHRLLEGHVEDVLSLDFRAPNMLASGGYDGEVILWNADSGAILHRLTVPGAGPLPISQLFFLTGRSLPLRAEITSTPDIGGAASVLSPQGLAHEAMTTSRGGKASPSDSSRVLLVLGTEGALWIWNVATFCLLGTIETGMLGGKMALNRDATLLAIGDSEGRVKIYSLPGLSQPDGQLASSAIDTAVALDPLLPCRHFWQAGHDSISSISFAVAETTLVVSFGNVCCLFSLEGALFGCYGAQIPGIPANLDLAHPLKQPQPLQECPILSSDDSRLSAARVFSTVGKSVSPHDARPDPYTRQVGIFGTFLGVVY
ncbi:putative Macrophage mannose receptor 1 [Paratrimastix pyriformis]|uniref:Macrophage mannose receptor 1 n=1 Tax=Paratrimastix pyriformis TaxID=342808 RepID=A0ABQ8U7S2_9EUKA|nr:putative Macrophage mannose receptor 1 [Paratrimastix pyriformis]